MQDARQETVIAGMCRGLRETAPFAPARSEPMQKRREKQGLVASVILLCALGCFGQESSRNEAQDLLERIARLNRTANLDTRDTALRALAIFPAASTDLRALRDACVSAHRGLLGAERSQAEVRSALDLASRQQTQGQGMPEPAALLALQSKLTGATEGLATARTALDACELKTREVTLKYR